MTLKTNLLTLASAAACVLFAGCETAPDDGLDPEDPVRASDIDPELADEEEEGIDEQACLEIVEEAQQVIDASMTCGQEAACGLAAGHELVADPCLPVLACWVPTSVHANLDRVTDQLIELDKRYREECGLCPTALCIDESQISASCIGNHCDLVEHRPWPDDLAAPAQID